MTFRRDLTDHIRSLIDTAGAPVLGASTATTTDHTPLPCLPGCTTDHTRDVATKCCAASTEVGSITPSYHEAPFTVTAHSYTEGQLRSAEIQLATNTAARFLDPDQALALAALLIEGAIVATTAARG